MHLSSMLKMYWFVENFASKVDSNQSNRVKVLDLGSQDICGSYRTLFSDSKYEYLGVDIEQGPNVDLVLDTPYDWSCLATDSYDIIISGQALEHIEFFWITVSEMTRVLKKDGLICIIVPHVWPEHRFPVDCYRFNTDGMIAMARYVNLEILSVQTNCFPNPDDERWYGEAITVKTWCGELSDTMLIAKKTYSGTTKYINTKDYKCVPENHEVLRLNMVPF